MINYTEFSFYKSLLICLVFMSYLDFDVVDTGAWAENGSTDKRREYVLGKVTASKTAFDKLVDGKN